MEYIIKQKPGDELLMISMSIEELVSK